jgi:hypothetical protein
MMPTSTDDKLAAMIGELADNFAKFQIEYATDRAEIKSDLRELEARNKGDLREFEARINGDFRELKAQVDGSIQELKVQVDGSIQGLKVQVDGSIRELKAQVDGSIQNLDTKFGTGLLSLEKRVDRGFGLQMWLAGFLIPATIGLIATAISLAFSAGHLDSSVKQLSARMDKLEQALEKMSSSLRPPTPPIGPSAANPPGRVYELHHKESLMGQIDEAITRGKNRQGEIDEPFHLNKEFDAEDKPGWLADGMMGLVLLDGKLTAEGIAKKPSFHVSYQDDQSKKNKICYSIGFQVKSSELTKFKDLILAIDPAGNLPFSICFVRP